jgi:hypothetical protein
MATISPLLDPAVMAALRHSSRLSDMLLGRLLRQAGPALTVEWLDLLVACGPLTGIPGLLTLYDVNRFARRNSELIENLLARSWPADAHSPPELHIVAPLVPWQPLSPALRRRRRCRAAVYLAVCTAAGHHPRLFEQARHYERGRRLPPSTPSPS